jgi:protein-tyrosine phosphatase
MAERLMLEGLRQRLGGVTPDVVVESAGTRGLVGRGMEQGSMLALRQYGLDGADFRARELSVQHVVAADLVLTATREHRAVAVRLHPRAASRTFTLREFARLVAGVDAEALTEQHLADRGRALVRAANGRRGLVPPASPYDDDLADPYRGPSSGFVACAELVQLALQPPLDLLAGETAAERSRSGGTPDRAGLQPGRGPHPGTAGPSVCHTPRVDDVDDLEARRTEWRRQQARVRRSRDLGLLILALGVLVLVYVALLVSGG